jgi:hypothetical protein
LQLILNQPQGHPTVSGHQFTTSAIFPDFKHLTAIHSFEVIISLSESFKTSEIDVNNELNVLQFWHTFNILHGVGVLRKKNIQQGYKMVARKFVILGLFTPLRGLMFSQCTIKLQFW